MGVPYAEVIGDPIAHSKSPLIHKFWLKKLGLDGDYRSVRVAAEGLPAYLASRRSDPCWRGCSVTLPHKESILAGLDEVRVCAVQAVNCVTAEEGRLVGFNTDIDGISEALDGLIDTSRPVCLIGAGGAAQAALAALDMLAVHRFHGIARSPDRSWSLLEPYRAASRAFSFSEGQEALQGCAGVVNATPLGMADFPAMPPSILDGLAGIAAGGFALDMVYAPLDTPFLIRAKREGLQTMDGLTVLIGQAACAFVRFFGAPAPREHDSELRERLTQ